MFKEVGTIIVAILLFGEHPLTPLNIMGLAVSLTGIGYYNYLKYRFRYVSLQYMIRPFVLGLIFVGCHGVLKWMKPIILFEDKRRIGYYNYLKYRSQEVSPRYMIRSS